MCFECLCKGPEWSKRINERNFDAGAVVINDTLMHAFGTHTCDE